MKKIVVIFLFYLFVGCSETKKEGVQILDFSADFKTYKSLDESDYRLSYEIVPLESTDRSLIHMIGRIVMNDHYIYTISEGVNVKIFDRKGKYLKTINHGRANNELIMPNDIMLEEKTGNVIFLDGLSMIKTFDSLGNFLNMQKLDIISTEMKKIGNKYLFYDGNMSKVDSNFVITNGDKKKHYSKKRCPKIRFYGAPGTHITSYMDDLYFMAEFDNVLYKMGENDEEPTEYAIFNNVFVDESVKNKDYFALIKEYEGRKFISLNRIWRLNDELFFCNIPQEGIMLYDKSTNTPYKHPLSGLYQIGGIQGGYNGKTLHCVVHEYLNRPNQKPSPQAQVLYTQINEWEKKNGIHENPYLVIVSYDKKK